MDPVRELDMDQAIGYAYGYADAKFHAEGGRGAARSDAMEFAKYYVAQRKTEGKSLQEAYAVWKSVYRG